MTIEPISFSGDYMIFYRLGKSCDLS